MAALEIMDVNSGFQSGYKAPSCEARGQVRSTLFHPDGYSLWEVDAVLDEGAELIWDTNHGDEAIYVVDGAIEVAGDVCPERAVAIIEAGVWATAKVTKPSRIIHFGPTATEAPTDGLGGPAQMEGRRVHVARLHEADRVGPEEGPGGIYYADATCPTCRLALFEVYCGKSHAASSHTHSEDEIIRVTRGEIRMGRTAVTAGMSVAIPGGYRYGFRTPDAFAFLNYRRDASTYQGAPGSTPFMEGLQAARRIHSGPDMD